MAQGVCWVARELGVPATVVAPDHAPRAKLDAVERLGGTGRHRAVRSLVGIDGVGRVPRPRRALRPSGARRAGDGRERRHRPRVGRAARRHRRGARALGRRRPDCRHRERARVGRSRRRASSPASPRPGRRSRRRSQPGARRPSTTGRRSSTAQARRHSCPPCGSAHDRWSRGPSPFRCATSPRRYGCSRREAASSPREPARSRSRPRSRDMAGMVASCASSQVATSTRGRSPRFSGATRPRSV